MSELLTKLENALDEVEAQLLSEFERIRKTLSAETYSAIDPGIKTALNEVVLHLWEELEHSGNAQTLSLRTEQHEIVAGRMIVIKKLLDARIPTAYLEEAEEQLRSQSSADIAVTHAGARKQSQKPRITIDEKKGLVGSIRDFLNKKVDGSSDDPAGIEENSLDEEGIGVYNEEGIYSAAKKLAGIASRFKTTGDDREMMDAVIRGKAVFESRDLSKVLPDEDLDGSSSGIRRTGASVFESRDVASNVSERPSDDSEIAKTPEAIRRKLQKATRRVTGASTFGARDLSNGPPPAPKATPEPKRERKKKKQSVAQTPEEIRKKLEARQSSTQSSGKASFGSKDVKHEAPQEFRAKPEKKKDPEPKKEEERPTTGKAVFEVKDLTTNPTDR
jgi:hypothetical protein